MKRTLWSFLACGTLAAGLSFAQTATETSTPGTPAPEAPKKEKVTKMNGQSFFGIVTLTDDYTLKVSSDSGIMKIPLALLGESDFKKFGLQKDRSQDGRLWSERKDALEDQKKEDEEGGKQKKSASSSDSSAIEIQLGEIAVFQPLISAYEMTQAGNKKSDGDKAEATDKDDKTQGSDEPGRKLFSGPGNIGNMLPFSGPGSSFAQPVMSAGGSAVQAASGLVPGLPGGPASLPGAP